MHSKKSSWGGEPVLEHNGGSREGKGYDGERLKGFPSLAKGGVKKSSDH